MIRNIKVLGLAVVALLAMTAVVASAAQASDIEIEGGEGTLTATQIGKHKFTVDGSSVECETAHFTATGASKTGDSTVVVHPTYEGCTAFGFINSTITTTGCNYDVTSGSVIEAGMKWNASIKLECETGKKIEIKASTCEATVSGPQTFGTGLTLVNTTESSPMDFDLNASGVEVATVKTKDGLLCPFSGTGATTGTYTGETTVTAKNSGGTAVGTTITGS